MNSPVKVTLRPIILLTIAADNLFCRVGAEQTADAKVWFSDPNEAQGVPRRIREQY